MRTRISRLVASVAPVVLLLTSLCPPPVRAQTLNVSSDRTIANGNPINGDYQVIGIGYDDSYNLYPGVKADFIGGSTQLFFVGPASLSIYGGSLGDGYGAYGGTINLYGGNIGTDNGIHLSGASSLNVYGKHLNIYNLAYYNPGYAGQYLLTGVLQQGYDLHTHLAPNNGSLTFNGVTTYLPTTPAYFLTRSYTIAAGNPINDQGIFAVGVDSSFVKYQGLQVDFVGGDYERIDGYSDSALNFQNGYGFIAAYDTTTVTVGGGQVGVSGYDSSILQINGGEGYVEAHDNSVAYVNGGYFGVRSADNGVVNLNSGAKVVGSLVSHDKSVVNINRAFIYDSAPVDAYDDSVVNYNGDPSSSNFNKVNTHDRSVLNILNGAVDRVSVADASILNVASIPGLTVSSAGQVIVSDSGVVNLGGGFIGGVSLSGSATMSIKDAGFVESISADGNSQVNLTASVYGSTSYDSVGVGDISLLNSASINLTRAAVNNLYTYSSSNGVVNLSASTVRFLVASGDTVVNIRDGNLHNDGYTYYNVNALGAYGSSAVNVSDNGGIAQANLNDSSILTVNGGAIGYVVANNNSVVHFDGGTIQDVYGHDSSVTDMFGGYLSSFFGFDSSVFNLYGGTIGPNTVSLLGRSAARIYGTGLTLSSALGTGSDANGTYTDYLLAGLLDSGDALNTHLHYYGNGASLYFNDAAIITGTAAAPEPGAMALLALPLIGMAVWRQRRG